MMADTFIWYELMTTDRDAALAFYKPVVGWQAEDMTIPEMGDLRYTILSASDGGVAGLMQMDAAQCEGEMRPHWAGYIGVADTDAAAARVAAARGTVLMAPEDIPGVGRFALIADPGGAKVYILAPLPRDDAPAEGPRMTPGHVGWHELYAGDGAAAFEFYSGQFGWSEASRFDMGAMGIYHLFATGGDEALGGIMTKPEQMPAPAWLYYFVVEGIDAAADRIRENGGSTVNGPMEVPDGSWIVQAVDPQGAMFALVSEQR
jgi:predicted enzyme related to lactoylglutathione lyase